MSTSYRYTLPVDQTEWKFDGHTDVTFTWEYDENRAGLLQLYSKGKQQQWDAAERIDWSQDLDPEKPMQLDDRIVPIPSIQTSTRSPGRSHLPMSIEQPVPTVPEPSRSPGTRSSPSEA